MTCCDIHVKRAALWRQPAIRELSRFYEWYYQDIPAKYRALHCDIPWWWKVSGAKVTFVRAIPRKHFSFKKSKTCIWYRQDVELPTYKNSETEPEQKYPSGLEMKDFFITGTSIVRNKHRIISVFIRAWFAVVWPFRVYVFGDSKYWARASSTKRGIYLWLSSFAPRQPVRYHLPCRM